MTERFQRQSFLGPDAEPIIEKCCIGVVGLGGGGSHIVQQLAHIGFVRFVIIDNDHVEESNLNRLVGANSGDVREERPKVAVAERIIRAISPKAQIKSVPTLWEESAESLRVCDVIIGCVDTFRARRELESTARRFLIPYIDIGMDVHPVDGQFFITGQVILSMPGHLCLRCVGFLTDDLLADEARRYGAAGKRPQVIWPNGMLASAAIGILMQLITPWHGEHPTVEYLELDGNRNLIARSNRLQYLHNIRCRHFEDTDNLGDPFYSAPNH